ncbi:hypothetical protein R4Z10_09065 [Niallia sp. XMNu-256]|uniref:hypothetical protein n=1 Tax=Niallia sp. XMNu-256 TaxID=3082444 RepID=UPI0030CA6E68
MKGQIVVYGDEIYTVIYDYENGQLEIEKYNSRTSYKIVELVKKEDVRILENQ